MSTVGARRNEARVVGGILIITIVVAFTVVAFDYASRRRGIRKLELLADQFDSGLYTNVLEKVGEYETDPDLRRFIPELLYMRWASEFRAGRRPEADATARTFLERFPRDKLAADIYFERWSDHLLRSEFGEAAQDLSALNSTFPSSADTIRANEISRKRLDGSAVVETLGGGRVGNGPG